MVLKYQTSPYPSLMEGMVVKIWEAQNDGPGAEVYTEILAQDIGGGHSIHTIIANGLDKVVHIVRLYTATSNQLLHEYNAEPKTDIVNIFDPIRFKIGDGGDNTPIAGTNTYYNSLLIGLEDNEYEIFRNKYGYLFPTLHYTINSDAGTWTLVVPDNFNDAEEFVIKRKTKVLQTVVNDSVVGKWFAGFVDINVDMNYSSSHLRKLFRFSGTCSYTFQASDAIPIGYAFVFQHFGLGDVSAKGTINFLNAPLAWNGVDKTTLDLPIFCEACFVFDGAKWNVVYLTTSSAFVPAGSIPPLTVLGAGNFFVGDVASGDPDFTVIHNLNITGDYNVYLSIKSDDPTQAYRNDKVGSTWFHHSTDKPNKFRFMLQEITGETQIGLNVSWLIVKI